MSFTFVIIWVFGFFVLAYAFGFLLFCSQWTFTQFVKIRSTRLGIPVEDYKKQLRENAPIFIHGTWITCGLLLLIYMIGWAAYGRLCLLGFVGNLMLFRKSADGLVELFVISFLGAPLSGPLYGGIFGIAASGCSSSDEFESYRWK